MLQRDSARHRELAPYLFCWAAEASLRRRRERLNQVRWAYENVQNLGRDMPHLSVPNSNPLKEMIEAESESINSQDIWGMALYEAGFEGAALQAGTDNPFAMFLRDLAAEIGDDVVLETASSFDYAEYRVCEKEALHLAGDTDVAEEILSGHVPLHDMPKELRGLGMWEQRAEWLRAKAKEYQEGSSRIIDKVST
jgi:hypothetical protein